MTFMRLTLLFALALSGWAAQPLALTPPMGWNSWNKFACKIDDKSVREMADAMITSGMRDAGYIYVNIDDCWQGKRDAQGVIAPNEKFPDMKALSAYVHSKGLKLGIYSSPGPKTCADYEGSYQHEEQDAKTYAEWGIDYLKYDWCSANKVYQKSDMPAIYKKMHDALEATGRPIVFSLCQYGIDKVWTWGASVGGNLWRTTGDISDDWKSMSTIGFDKQAGLEASAGPGHWNDPDMLEIGNGNMSDEEYRTHMSLWCLLAAPLLAGNDIRTMTDETKSILLNKEVIAVDQDPLGKQGYRLSKEGNHELWVKEMKDGSLVVGLFNRGNTADLLSISWADLKLTGKHKVRDLWAHQDRGKISNSFPAQVSPHGVLLIQVSR